MDSDFEDILAFIISLWLGILLFLTAPFWVVPVLVGQWRKDNAR